MDGTPSTGLAASGVSRHYIGAGQPVVALRDIDLHVPRGEWVSVTGRSGSGKSTLLNCLSGIDDVDSGTVFLDGVDLYGLSDRERAHYRARSMGFVFQAYNLVPVLSAVENVELPLLLSRQRRSVARERARDTLALVGMAPREHERPTNLSGGEQQRVAIARALVGEPSIIWADEPTAALDTENGAAILSLFERVHSAGLTLVVVTHDPVVAAKAERIIEMSDGVIISDVAPRKVLAE